MQFLSPNRVSKFKDREKDALTNLIQLVRYAYETTEELKSFVSFVSSRFELWSGQKQRPLTEKQKEIAREIAKYIATNGAFENLDEFRSSFDITLVAQANKEFGTMKDIEELLTSLSSFILAA